MTSLRAVFFDVFGVGGCFVSPLVCDGEGQAGFGQGEASSGDAAGRGQPGVRHPRQHRNEICRRSERRLRASFSRFWHSCAPASSYSPVRLSSKPTSSELR